jgi:hypothetical protein
MVRETMMKNCHEAFILSRSTCKYVSNNSARGFVEQ